MIRSSTIQSIIRRTNKNLPITTSTAIIIGNGSLFSTAFGSSSTSGGGMNGSNSRSTNIISRSNAFSTMSTTASSSSTMFNSSSSSFVTTAAVAATAAAAALFATGTATATATTKCDNDSPEVFASSSDAFIYANQKEDELDDNNLCVKVLYHAPSDTDTAADTAADDDTDTDDKMEDTSKTTTTSGKEPNTVIATSTTNTLTQPLPTLSSSSSDLVTTRKMYFYKSPKLSPSSKDRFRLFAGPSSTKLGTDVAKLLNVNLNSLQVGSYTDGETSIKIQDSIRGKNVFVLYSTSTNDDLVGLLLTISALRRASAKNITAIIPYYGYCRQDMRRMREPVAAADVAKMLETMGVDQVMCVDLHNDSLRGFFSPNITVDHLPAIPVAAAYFHEKLSADHNAAMAAAAAEITTSTDTSATTATNVANFQHNPPPITIVASHEGQVKRAKDFRAVLIKLGGTSDKDSNIEMAFVSKVRRERKKKSSSKGGEEDSSNSNGNQEGKDDYENYEDKDDKSLKSRYEPYLVGNVANRTCIVVDDIVSTGNTLQSTTQILNENNAGKIYAWATHGVFDTKKNCENIIRDMDGLEFLLISNSLQRKAVNGDNAPDATNDDATNACALPKRNLTNNNPKIRQLSIAPLVAEAVARLLTNKSITGILNLDNLEDLEKVRSTPTKKE